MATDIITRGFDRFGRLIAERRDLLEHPCDLPDFAREMIELWKPERVVRVTFDIALPAS